MFRADKKGHFLLKTALMMAGFLLPISSAAAGVPVVPDDPASPHIHPFFYFGQNYGSESQFGPVNVFFNVGMVTIGRMTQSPQLSYIDFNGSGSVLVNSLLRQRHAIEADYDTGFPGFFLNEFVPPFLPAVPNYFLHFAGEGMLSRKLEEYYRSRGMKGIWPRTLAVSTILLSQQINELVEFGFPLHPKSDPIADLYFNAAGIVAFSFDGFARLFANDRIRLYYWPGQPVIDLRDEALFNHGESYLLRTTLGHSTNWKFALLFGMPGNGLGVSIPVNDDDNITVMPFATDQITRPRGYHPPSEEQLNEWLSGDHPRFNNLNDVVIKEFYYSVNLYWDRRGSLLAGAALSYKPDFSLSLNVYPGVLHAGPLRLGGYILTSKKGAASMGITMSVSPIMPGIRF